MPRVLVESAVKAALHERHAATIEADAPAGPVARNGIKPAAETKRTWHSSHVRNLGIRHTDNDAFELWMPRADRSSIETARRYVGVAGGCSTSRCATASTTAPQLCRPSIRALSSKSFTTAIHPATTTDRADATSRCSLRT